MDGDRFDQMTKTLAAATATRRRVLRGLTTRSLGFALSRRGRADTVAKEATARGRCRKKKEDCRGDNQCCSGVCMRRRCRRAPGQSTCTVEKDTCRAKRIIPCNNKQFCACFITARGTSFCGDQERGRCASCTPNADCVEVTGAGSVCIRSGGGFCCDSLGSTCITPCRARATFTSGSVVTNERRWERNGQQSL